MARKRPAEAYGAVPDNSTGTPLSSSQSYANPSSSASQGYPYATSQEPTQDTYSHREPPRKQARTSAYASSDRNSYASNRSGNVPNAGRGSSQANPYVLEDDDEDEDDGSQEVQDSTQGYNEEEYRWGFYGVLPTKIVGVRYYSGVATMGEMVVLRREPNNAYDSQFDRTGHCL